MEYASKRTLKIESSLEWAALTRNAKPVHCVVLGGRPRSPAYT